MKQLETLSVVSPGFFGLNTQESGITLSPNFAQLTDNVVIDKYGRLGSRKGWQMRTDSGITQLAGASISFLLEHINADNTSVILSAGNNKLFKKGDDGDTLINITPSLSTVTGNNWKGASLYDHALIVQENHEPIIYSEGATTNCNTIYEHSIEKLQVDSSVATFGDLPEVPLTNDRYLTVDNYQVWEWNGSAWVNITPTVIPTQADLITPPALEYYITEDDLVFGWNGSAWVDVSLPSVTLVADLPVSATDGDLYIVTDTDEVYRWDGATSDWVLQSFESVTQQADLPISPYAFLTNDTHKLFEWDAVDEIWEDTTPREISSPTALPLLPTSTYLVENENKVYELRGVTWTDISPVFSFGVSYPRDVIAAYGRFWVHDGETIYWSTDIADVNFPAFEGGTSGTLNISAVLPNNVDTIVSLAVHNGFLIIFCERNIVIYQGAESPIGDFSLADIISGVGCVARDSVQNTGNDLIFLSDTGVRSLGRLIQEKSLPMRDLTKNIRDDLIKDVQEERSNTGNLDGVRAIYSELNAFYLLSFPSTETVYCLDMRQPLEDGSARVTVWYSYPVTAFLRRRDRELMLGKPNGIGRYFGYTDNGTGYRLRYFSHYLDMGMSTTNKMLKQISATVIGGSNQSFVIKTNFDYQEAPRSYPFTIVTGDVSEYGTAKFIEYSEFKGTVANYASLPLSPVTGDAYLIDNSPIVYDGNGNNISDDVNEGKVYQWNGSTWVDVTSTWKTTFTPLVSSEYSFGIVLDSIKSSVGGSGNTIQIGFEADVNGNELSVQKIDMFVKTGRMS